MQSRIDAQYIIDIGADPNKVIVTGNTKYDQTYGIVTPEEKRNFWPNWALPKRITPS